ncbi:MAG TPA: hypothetical protein VFZ09_48350 [Archangium sp.]|uniref:hypothetical protein n=1 Tax=Archangium sp. TaxID=1872627 RepID=UPI002E2FFB63|nr:hypothetical protein [Archangium sp.]HEX5754090.1 hypothetical protein [Archangium sp.]
MLPAAAAGVLGVLLELELEELELEPASDEPLAPLEGALELLVDEPLLELLPSFLVEL